MVFMLLLRTKKIMSKTHLIESPVKIGQSAQNIVCNISKQGLVVQSMVSLTSSLRGQLVKCFMTL